MHASIVRSEDAPVCRTSRTRNDAVRRVILTVRPRTAVTSATVQHHHTLQHRRYYLTHPPLEAFPCRTLLAPACLSWYHPHPQTRPLPGGLEPTSNSTATRVCHPVQNFIPTGSSRDLAYHHNLSARPVSALAAMTRHVTPTSRVFAPPAAARPAQLSCQPASTCTGRRRRARTPLSSGAKCGAAMAAPGRPAAFVVMGWASRRARDPWAARQTS